MRISPLPFGTIDRLPDVDLLQCATNFYTYFLFWSSNVFFFIDFGTLGTENGQ